MSLNNVTDSRVSYYCDRLIIKYTGVFFYITDYLIGKYFVL